MSLGTIKIQLETLNRASGDPITEVLYSLGHAEYRDIFFPSAPAHHYDWCLIIHPTDVQGGVFSSHHIQGHAD
jgi:hypothetical protein